jgi:sec-independent protein translocase protein TatC
MEQELTIREHMKELRSLIIQLSIPLAILFIFFFWASKYFVTLLITYMGLNINQVVALNPFENLTATITVATAFTLFFGIPMIFLRIFQYIKPTVSKKNRKYLFRILLSATLLGIIGIIIGIFVFSKFVLFMLSTSYLIVNPMWSISSVVRYVLMMSITMAIIMQIVLIIPLLIKIKLVELESFTNHRPAVFILIAIISAIISPPDPLSMFIMLIPIYGAYELGILMAKIIMRGEKK